MLVNRAALPGLDRVTLQASARLFLVVTFRGVSWALLSVELSI